MKISVMSLLAAAVAAPMLISACTGMEPLTGDQAPVLSPDQGMVVVVLDSKDVLNHMTFKGTDEEGIKLTIPMIQPGMSMYLFPTKQCTYCLTDYYVGPSPMSNNQITQFDQKHGDCFDVIAGKTVYSGNLAPRAYGSTLRVEQDYHWDWFVPEFKKRYPTLSEKYPLVTP